MGLMLELEVLGPGHACCEIEQTRGVQKHHFKRLVEDFHWWLEGREYQRPLSTNTNAEKERERLTRVGNSSLSAMHRPSVLQSLVTAIHNKRVNLCMSAAYQ